MPTPQPGRVVKQTSPKASPVKAANKAAIAKAFDNQSPTVKDRVKQWQEQGGGVKTAPEVFIETEGPGSVKSADKITTKSPTPKPKSASAKSTPSAKKGAQSGASPDAKGGEEKTGGQKDGDATELPKPALPESPTKVRQQAISAAKKREISAAKLRIAQAVLGPQVRPSERLRRLSEARKKAAAAAEAEAAAEAAAAAAAAAEAELPKSPPPAKLKKEPSTPKEAGTPKKRVISDGHWRKEKTPPKEYILPKPVPKPTVEGWLEKISVEPRPTKSRDGIRVKSDDGIRVRSDDGIRVRSIDSAHIQSDDGIRVTAISDADAQREKEERHQERRRKRKERAEAKRAAYGRPLSSHASEHTRTTSKGPESFSTEDTHSQPDTGTVRSRGLTPPHTKTLFRSDHQRTHSAPTSLAPTSIIEAQEVHRSGKLEPGTPPESYLGYSSQDDSDNLTSISRRRRRTSGPKPKKNIFTHAAKLFTKPEPKLEPEAHVPPGPVRVPTVESWLNHAVDPFAGTAGEDAVEIPAPLNVKSRDQSPATTKRSISRNQGRRDSIDADKAANSGRPRKSPEQDISDADDGKKKRLKRVIRHRDGTVTTEDADVTIDAPQASPTLRRRGAQRQESPGAKRRSRAQNDRMTDYTAQSRLDSVSNGSETSTEGLEEIPEDISFVGRTRRPLPRVDSSQFSHFSATDDLRRRKTASAEKPTHLSRKVKHSNSGGMRKSSSGSDRQRLAKHSDLISVLSVPAPSGTSIRSARSIRTYRSRLETASIDDILREFASDEEKYMRELYTLVDGVVPVLLSSSLSSKGASMTANLFHASANAVASDKVAKPIFDIGMALEKLKVHHAKAPSADSKALLQWAKGGMRYYKDYLRAWRAGFQDVVVNLAPQEGTDEVRNLDKGMQRDANGDVVDNNGERVDVAFLLKRPLVRLKYLAKTMAGINHIEPSTQADELSLGYKDLVTLARTRSNEERSRLEDEAAASVDTTRARDPRTLEPVDGVHVTAHRHVKARDTFDLELVHSTGQRLDCTVELTLREDAAEVGNAGDLLVAEMDGTGRWLLFPPLHVDQFSARVGDTESEIVIMVRGGDGDGSDWHEVMLLISEEDNVASEWVQLLGTSPVPPQRHRGRQNGASFQGSTRSGPASRVSASTSYSAGTNESMSTADLEVPLGERPQGSIKRWKDTSNSRVRKRHTGYSPSTILEESSTASGATAIPESTHRRTHDGEPSRSERLPRNLNEAMKVAGSPHSGLKRARAQRRTNWTDESTESAALVDSSFEEATSSPSTPATPSFPTSPLDRSTQNRSPVTPGNKTTPSRYHRPQSLTVDFQPPISLKKRSGSSPTTSLEKSHTDYDWRMPDTQSVINGGTAGPDRKGKVESGSPENTGKTTRGHRRTSSPLKHEYAPSELSDAAEESDASTVVHDSSCQSESSSDSELDDDDAQSVLVPMSAIGRYRKAPRATPPESLADNTLSPSQSASQAPYREVPSQPGQGRKSFASVFFWSDTGSWQNLWPQECVIIVSPGLIEAYEKPLGQDGTTATPPSSRPASRKSSGVLVEQLLLGLELTPLVPIRRGTALDISIRSPPTPDSKVTTNTNNNFLFRSRSPEECEMLYTMINHSRINNPTYIALQNARATSFNAQFQDSDRKDNSRLARASSWFGLGGRKNSYRASIAPSQSLSKQTDSSTGSMSSALSALRNLGRGTGRFNIARSTVTSRQGSGSNSLFTSSEGTNSSGASVPSIFTNQPADASLGLSNCKIRFYLRETTTKWSDLGSARLTIMRPNNALNGGAPGVPAPVDAGPSMPIEHAGREAAAGHGVGMQPSGGYASLGNKVSANDKRIVVIGDPKNLGGTKDGAWKTLLDVTLGESCFERVARTGIAVSVWENFEGGMVAKQGGVIAGRVRVYMMQFKSEADTAYTYSIVGKLRY